MTENQKPFGLLRTVINLFLSKDLMMPAERDSKRMVHTKRDEQRNCNSPRAASASRLALAAFVLRNKNDKKEIFE